MEKNELWYETTRRQTKRPGNSSFRNRIVRAAVTGYIRRGVKLHPDERLTGQPPSPRTARLVGLALALVTLLVYLPAGFHDFIFFDDPAYVADNGVVQAGLTWAGFKWAWVGWHASNWHPLTWLSHMLDCELFGVNPGAQHLINVLLHAVNAVLLFGLWRRLTRTVWPGAVLAALFAWHPLHVESVAWIAERKDVLSTLFGLLSLLAYAEYVERGGRRSEVRSQKAEGKHPITERQPRNNIGHPTSNIQHPTSIGGQGPTSDLRPPTSDLRRLFPLPASLFYFLSLSCFALSLLAKPMLVTLPFVCLLLDFWPLRRFERSTLNSQPSTIWRLAAEKWPFFLLSLASCVVTYLAQRGEAVMSMDERALGMRLENATVTYADYVLKMVWPTRLGIIYPLPGHYPAGQVVLAGIFLAGISAVVWWRRQSPWWLTGWLWFLGTLVPVIGLVQVGNQSMADRYTYWPAIGLFAAVAYGGADWAARRQARRLPTGLAAGLVLGLCVAATERQLGFWKNTQTLFSHTLAVAKDNPVAQMILGAGWEHTGATEEALRCYEDALKLDASLVMQMPGGTKRRLAVQVALLKAQAAEQQGRRTNAMSLYRAALDQDPSLVEAHNNLANLLDASGATQEALLHYQTAIRLAPAAPQACENLGAMLLNLGRFDEAMQQYQEAARRQPGDPHVFFLLGKAWLRHGQSGEAAAQFRHALELEANDAESLTFLARILATDENPNQRDGKAAVALAEKANALTGGEQPLMLDALALAYAETGRFLEAQQVAGKALDLAAAAKLPDLANGIRRHLQSFQAGQPGREAFTNNLQDGAALKR